MVKEYAALPAVECYAGQLNRVFLNLSVNPIDALEQGKERLAMPDSLVRNPTIRIFTEIGNAESVRVRIAANGLGVSETVSCISEPGRGTEFCIEIPVRQKRFQIGEARRAFQRAAVTDAA